jgi:hypothetical protein
MDELIKQAPYIAALVIIVYIFVKEMKESRQDYLQAQAERDKVFISGIEPNNKVIAELAEEVARNTATLIRHDSEMKITSINLEKSLKRK